MLNLDHTAVITTAQLFAIWRSIEALSGDPGFSIKLVRDTSTSTHKLAFLAALYAANFRDGLQRIARFKKICSPDQIIIEEKDHTVSITTKWPHGTAAEPAFSIDASFAMMLELGRRGTGRHIVPVAVHYGRKGPPTALHEAFFGCPIKFGAECNALIFNAEDLDKSFPGHNEEILNLLTPGLATELADLGALTSITEQVKLVLKRQMASGRPNVAEVAREMALSERTLQRRIANSGTTFRALLDIARRELGRSLLSDPAIDIEEIAFLLGFEDPNSYYRAFKGWERTTPGRWRRQNSNSSNSSIISR